MDGRKEKCFYMKLKDLIEKYTLKVVLCGYCECKYHNLAYPSIHESVILKIKPELLEVEK